MFANCCPGHSCSRSGLPVNELTDKQLLEVLSHTERHFLELKAKEIKPSKLTKAVSSFANADGGELCVGIAENVTRSHQLRIMFPHPNGHFGKKTVTLPDS